MAAVVVVLVFQPKEHLNGISLWQLLKKVDVSTRILMNLQSGKGSERKSLFKPGKLAKTNGFRGDSFSRIARREKHAQGRKVHSIF